MAFDIKLMDRVRKELTGIANVQEKKMFGGLTFMVNEKMCISISKNRIMCRINPLMYDNLVASGKCEGVIMKGKIYKGFVYVHAEKITSKKELSYWVKLCLEYNAIAKASSKEKAI